MPKLVTRLVVMAAMWIGFMPSISQAANTFANTGPLATARREHTATLLPNGKLLVVGGSTGSNGSLASAEIYDPATGSWSVTGSLATARYSHTATLLPNGKVLVVGGYGNSNGSYLAGAELYDPATGTWTATDSLATARRYHTATLLPNGKLLVVGGNGSSGYLASAELYDPATGSWSVTGSLATARYSHTATLLSNGKLLVAGGFNGYLANAELYDPATGIWTVTGSLTIGRAYHTATLLPNGKLIVTGGNSSSGSVASAELYNSATGTWTTTGSLATARLLHTATLLPNGKLLVVGGNGSGYLASAELYDPATGTWAASGPLAAVRGYHTATLLPNGKLLVAAGLGSGGNLASAELYDSATGTWAAAGNLAHAHSGCTATLLPTGKVLVAGGYDGSDGGYGNEGYLARAELYNPATGTWTATASLATGRQYHSATLLPNGKLLVAGGYNLDFSGSLATAELYDPATGSWTATGSLASAHHAHTATLLPNGKVLVAGGVQNGAIVASAELYDPATGSWTATGSLATARMVHTATLLPNGKVLVAGGSNNGNSGFLTSAELYDPATGIWTSTGALSIARGYYTMKLMPNGKVLVAGGRYNGNNVNSALFSSEVYDPVIGTWTATGSLVTARYYNTATLLPNGKLLVAGGVGNNGNPLAGAEVYDPTTGTWTATGSLATARNILTSTLLPNGKVLVTGGFNNGYFASAELYDVGLGFSGASRPVIGFASFDASGRLVLTGAGFLGISSASGGNGSQDSPTNYPVLQLRRLDNEQCVFLSYDPSVNVSDTSLRSAPVAAFPGYALATVFTNGIPSASAMVSYVLPAVPDIALEAPTGTPVTNGSGTLAYGSIATGQTKDLIVTVRNTGSGGLATIAASIAGPDAGQFSLVSTPPATLAAGTSAPFTIRYSPTSLGSKSAMLSIASNDPDENPFTLALTGTANNSPSDLMLSATSVVENAPANTTVGTFSSIDPDAGDSFTYSLVSGSGSNDNAAFTITGAALKINSSPVFATKSSYAIRIRTTDSGGLFFEKPFTITITMAAVVFTDWATAAGLTGANAALTATPFNDGVENILKYAFNMNASGPDVSVLTPGGNAGLPQISVDTSGAVPVLRVAFLRRKGSGLIYTPQRSNSLGSFVGMAGTQTVTSINAQWERVTVEEPAPPATAPSAFARVQVSLP